MVCFRKGYCLSIIMLAGLDERRGYNELVTMVFGRLYGAMDHSRSIYEPQQKVYGTVPSPTKTRTMTTRGEEEAPCASTSPSTPRWTPPRPRSARCPIWW